MDTTFTARLATQLVELKAQGLFKSEHAIETPQRAEIPLISRPATPVRG